MTARDTPSPEPVLRLLEESGLPEEPLLVDAVEHIGALGEGPAPDASAELGQLMADGGRAPRSRRNKRRITFIGGALAVSMGAGMSGVAAGTLHLPSGLDDAVDSIVRFTARDSADRAERPAHPPADASEVRAPSGSGAAGASDEHGTAGPPGDKPLRTPAAAGPAPWASSAPSAAGVSVDSGFLPAPASGARSTSAVSGASAVSPAAPPVAPSAQGPAGAVPPLPAPSMRPSRDARISTMPAGPAALVAVPAPNKASDSATAGQGRVEQGRVEQGKVGGKAGQRKAGPVKAGQDTAGPVKAGLDTAGPVETGLDTTGPVETGQDTAGPIQKGQDETGQDRKVRVNSLDVGPAVDEVQALQTPRQPGVSWLRVPAGPSNPFLDDTPMAWESDRMELFLAEMPVDPAAVPPEEYPAPDAWADDVVPGEVAVPEVPDATAADVVLEEPGEPAAEALPDALPKVSATGVTPPPVTVPDPAVPDTPPADVVPSPGDVQGPAGLRAPATSVTEAGNDLPASR